MQMNNIYYDGNLKASLTVGSVSDINPLNAYTKDQVNELLGEKSDVNHTHGQYLTEHQSLDHLALKEHTHDEYLTEHQDISHLASKEELNEVKQSVSEGKKLIASAITDMGVDTLATDTWKTMVENILNINPYYIEYTVIPSGENDILDNYKYIPNIKNIGDSDFHRNYDGVRITLKDGSITKDLNTLVTDVEKIRIYYNARTEQLRFRGSLYDIVYIKTVDYLKTDNFTNLGNMFQGTRYLETINTNEWVINSSVTNLSSTFYGCNALKKLDLSNWNTANIKVTSFMLSGVPTDVDWCYDGTNYANWTLTEEQTGFSVKFPWSKVTLTLIFDDPSTGEEIHREIIEYPKGTEVNTYDICSTISIEGYKHGSCDGGTILTMDEDKEYHISCFEKEDNNKYGTLKQDILTRKYKCSECGYKQLLPSAFGDLESPTGYKCPECQTILEYIK